MADEVTVRDRLEDIRTANVAEMLVYLCRLRTAPIEDAETHHNAVGTKCLIDLALMSGDSDSELLKRFMDDDDFPRFDF